MKLHEGLHVAAFQDGRVEICAGMETMLKFSNFSNQLLRLTKTLINGISRSDYFLRATNLGISRQEAQGILTQLQNAELISLRDSRFDSGLENSLWRRIGGRAMLEAYRKRSKLRVSFNLENTLTRLLAIELATAGVGTFRLPSTSGSFHYSKEVLKPDSDSLMAKFQGLELKAEVTPPRGKVDLAILLSWGFPDPLLTAKAMRENQAHLPVVVGNDYVEIGPLVVPGLTPCTACVSNHRREFIPDILERAVSLIGVDFPQIETSLAATGAALAGTTALAFLDHRAISAGQVTRADIDGGIEILTYPTHPDCACCELPAAGDIPKAPCFTPTATLAGSDS